VLHNRLLCNAKQNVMKHFFKVAFLLTFSLDGNCKYVIVSGSVYFISFLWLCTVDLASDINTETG